MYAPNPSLIRLLRVLLYLGICGLCLVEFALCVAWFATWNSFDPAIKPSWGSPIFLLILSLITPGGYFGYLTLIPLVIPQGTFLGVIRQSRTELLFMFGMAIMWISAVLSTAVDVGGYENCIWDTYYYYPLPSNFQHSCDLLNHGMIPVGYTIFGLIVYTWVVFLAITAYIFLYLDQEVLTEPLCDLGARAYGMRAYSLADGGRPNTTNSRGSDGMTRVAPTNTRSSATGTGSGTGMGSGHTGSGSGSGTGSGSGSGSVRSPMSDGGESGESQVYSSRNAASSARSQTSGGGYNYDRF